MGEGNGHHCEGNVVGHGGSGSVGAVLVEGVGFGVAVGFGPGFGAVVGFGFGLAFGAGVGVWALADDSSCGPPPNPTGFSSTGSFSA